jgi:hypothetical protein
VRARAYHFETSCRPAQQGTAPTESPDMRSVYPGNFVTSQRGNGVGKPLPDYFGPPNRDFRLDGEAITKAPLRDDGRRELASDGEWITSNLGVKVY